MAASRLWHQAVVPVALAASSALAQPATDYCALLSKEDVEAALKMPVTKVTAAPFAEVPSTTTRDQTCVFSAGSRALRMTVTATLSPAQAQSMLSIDVMGHAGAGKPVALPGIGDETVMASPRTVIMRKGKLVLDISVADFGDSDAERVALARALAAEAADKIKSALRCVALRCAAPCRAAADVLARGEISIVVRFAPLPTDGQKRRRPEAPPDVKPRSA